MRAVRERVIRAGERFSLKNVGEVAFIESSVDFDYFVINPGNPKPKCLGYVWIPSDCCEEVGSGDGGIIKIRDRRKGRLIPQDFVWEDPNYVNHRGNWKKLKEEYRFSYTRLYGVACAAGWVPARQDIPPPESAST